MSDRASNENNLPPREGTKRLTPSQAAMCKLADALPPLAGMLVAHGEPAANPLARLTTPPVTQEALLSLPPAEAAERAIMLVRGALHRIRGKGALTAAAKRVGNAALGVKRALAVEAARRERIALREAGLLPPRKRTRGERPRPPSRAMAA